MSSVRDAATADRRHDGGFLLDLGSARLGATPFCPTIRVNVTSLTVVLNAGVGRDVHVVVGEGERECSFP